MYREQSLQKHRFAFAVITGDRDKEGLGEQFQGHQVKHTLRGGGVLYLFSVGGATNLAEKLIRRKKFIYMCMLIQERGSSLND